MRVYEHDREYGGYRSREYDEALDIDGLTDAEISAFVGCPVLNSHSAWSTMTVVGVIDEAKREGAGDGAKLVVRIRLSKTEDDLVSKVRDGILRKVSLGYQRKAGAVITEREGDVPLRKQPFIPAELSLVAIGADAGSGTRSASNLDALHHHSPVNSDKEPAMNVDAILGMAVRIDWLTSYRDAAEVRLTAVEIELLVARADADQIEHRLRTVTAALESERTRSLASERLASRLRERIARDAGTDRDGQTAPVLRDTIEKLQERSSFEDGQSVVPASSSLSPSILEPVFLVPLVRQSVSWTLTVVVAGRVELVAPVGDQAACRDAAVAVVEEIKARPEFASELTGQVLIVCSSALRMEA